MSTLIGATGGRAEAETWPATAVPGPGTRATAAAALTEAPTEAAFGRRAAAASRVEVAAFGLRASAATRMEVALGLRASGATRMEVALGMRAVPAGATFRMGARPGAKAASRVPTGPGKGKPSVTSPSRGTAGAAAAPCPVAVTAWIGAGPGLNEPAGFAVDLDRVLTVLPRRNFVPLAASVSSGVASQRSRRPRGRGRWSGVPFAGMVWPNVSRIWSRGKGWRR